MKPEELVTIATFNEPTVAHLARGKLEAHGITAYLGNEHIVGTNWFYANMVGGVELQVAQADAPQAAQLLQEKPDYQSEPHSQEEPALSCPACSSTDLVELPRTTAESVLYLIFAILLTILSLALIWVFMGLWVLQKKQWRCRQCHHQWRQRNRPFPT